MGYCAYNIKQKDVNKLKSLFTNSRHYKLIDNFEDYDIDKVCVWFENNQLWMHNSHEEKISKYLDKKKFKFY